MTTRCGGGDHSARAPCPPMRHNATTVRSTGKRLRRVSRRAASMKMVRLIRKGRDRASIIVSVRRRISLVGERLGPGRRQLVRGSAISELLRRTPEVIPKLLVEAALPFRLEARQLARGVDLGAVAD